MTTVPAQFLVLHDFLTAEEREAFLTYVQRDAEFSPASVTSPGVLDGRPDPTFRRASVANPDTDVQVFALLEDKLRAVLPHARRETGVPHFSLGHIERQVTTYRHGDFFRSHTDHGDAWNKAASRRLSFVYYFHDNPKVFTGGELRVYDQLHSAEGGVSHAETFQLVEPVDNSIVFFPSTTLHEVCPVLVDGDPEQKGAARCSVTGWFHDREHVRPSPPMDSKTRTALTQRYTPSFTLNGFEKMRTPPSVQRKLREVYRARINTTFPERVDEVHLPTGTPDLIDIDDVKGEIHHAMHVLHEHWSGVELVPTAAYGLRVYRAGQTLAPHTDILETHVISSIVHIAHDTTEPWPLRIVDLHGKEHDVFLEEGEMLLYESARCPHARPLPLQGSAYCSLFLHYKPVDWTVTYWSLIDQARSDGATDVLPRELWPDDA